MPGIPQAPTVYDEDVTIPSTAYATGGVTITLSKAIAVTEVYDVSLRSVASGLGFLFAPANGSESGQTFKLKAFVTGTASGDGLNELVSASTAIEGLIVHVRYAGVP